MKRKILTVAVVLAVLFLCTGILYAGNGDLIVNGNLGVGTTTPQGKAEVNGNMTIDGDTTMKGNTTTNGNTIVNGNLGVGTATPGQKLSVVGTIESTSGGVKFPDGSIQTTAGGSWIFGGMYSIGDAADNTTCGYGGSSYTNKPNPITGGYSCPAGFTDTIISHVNLCWPAVGGVGYSTHMCWK